MLAFVVYKMWSEGNTDYAPEKIHRYEWVSTKLVEL